MVYCSRCGTLNSDDANVCVKCGTPLPMTSPEWNFYHRHRHRHYHDDYYHRYPRAAGLAALVFGAIVLLIGLSFLFSEIYNFSFPWWPVFLVLIGVYVVFIGVWRSRRHSVPPPPQ